MGLQDRDWYRDIYQQKRAPMRRRPGAPPPLRLAARSSPTAAAWGLMATLAAIAVGGFLFVRYGPYGVPASSLPARPTDRPAPVVANLPRLAGCLQAAASCQCVTERGTLVELPKVECEAIAGGGRR